MKLYIPLLVVLGTSSLRDVRGQTTYTFDNLKVQNDNVMAIAKTFAPQIIDVH